jgi:SecD/SecF fusion protein
MLSDSAVSRKFPADVQFALGDLDHHLRLSAQYQLLYALKKNADPISNRNIAEAHAELEDEDRPFIAMTLDAAGTRRWEKMTEKNVGRAIAISINNKVIIAPQVAEPIVGGSSRISMSGEENCRVVSVLLTSSELKLPVQIIQSQVKQEEKFSPKVLTGYINYILVFILSFAISFCVIWFVFKPGKKLSRNV